MRLRLGADSEGEANMKHENLDKYEKVQIICEVLGGVVGGVVFRDVFCETVIVAIENIVIINFPFDLAEDWAGGVERQSLLASERCLQRHGAHPA